MIANRYDLAPHLRQKTRRVGADVPEALNDEAAPGNLLVQGLQVLVDGDRHAAPRGLGAAHRPEQIHGLARHHARMEAIDSPVLVHDPRHHLGIGVDVRRRDVRGVADELVQALDKPAGETFELELGQLVRVHRDPALGASKRYSHQRRLPRHQRGQRPHLVNVDCRVIAQPALEGTAAVVVLNAIADERANTAVIHADIALDPQLPVRSDQKRNLIFPKVGNVPRLAHELVDVLECVRHCPSVPMSAAE